MIFNHCLEVTALLQIALFTTSSLANATCYRADTHKAADSTYTPCNPDQPFSMCYRSQVDAFDDPPDYACLASGITLQNNTKWGIAYWRQSCTDPTWQSSFCQTAFDGCIADANDNVPITPCGNLNSTSWCCGQANTACCGTSQAIVIAAVIGISSSSSASSSTSIQSSTSQLVLSPISTVASTTASTTSTSTTTASPTSSSKPIVNNGLSTGAKAGIGIGAALGALAVLGLAAFMLWKRKRKMALPNELKHSELDDGSTLYKDQVNELYAKHGMSELPVYT